MGKAKKALAILLLGVIIMGIFSGCSLFEKKYNVTYDLKDSYRYARDAYPAGTRVRIVYDAPIATDTDYSFHVVTESGEEVKQEFTGIFGEIIFTMPKENIKVYADIEMSMAFINDVE